MSGGATRSLALHGSRRRWVTRVHRWTGLVIMASMLVAALTGTWLVFRVEMDRLVNPHLRVVQPGSNRVTLASIVDAAERRFPDSMMQAHPPGAARGLDRRVSGSTRRQRVHLRSGVCGFYVWGVKWQMRLFSERIRRVIRADQGRTKHQALRTKNQNSDTKSECCSSL